MCGYDKQTVSCSVTLTLKLCFGCIPLLIPIKVRLRKTEAKWIGQWWESLVRRLLFSVLGLTSSLLISACL